MPAPPYYALTRSGTMKHMAPWAWVAVGSCVGLALVLSAANAASLWIVLADERPPEGVRTEGY
jgi:hypothetical protein